MRQNPSRTETRWIERLIRREATHSEPSRAVPDSSDRPAGFVDPATGALVRFIRFGISTFGGPDVFAPERAI